MKSPITLLLLSLVSFVAAVPVAADSTETTCVTKYSGINELIVDLQDRVRVADPTFLVKFYGSRSTTNCGGVGAQKYVDNILAVIATPDSWCSINGDGFGGYECEIEYL